MTDCEEFDALMEEGLKNTVNTVKEELTARFKFTEPLTSLTPLEPDQVKIFCEEQEIEVLKDFEASLTTPFAIGRYIMLTIERDRIIKRVEKELEKYLDPALLKWSLTKNFTNQINFMNTMAVNSDEKPQSLTVNYRLDPETDNIIYSLVGQWGWDISIQTLRAILCHEQIKASVNSKANSINTDITLSSTMTSDGILINAGNLEVLVRKT